MKQEGVSVWLRGIAEAQYLSWWSSREAIMFSFLNASVGERTAVIVERGDGKHRPGPERGFGWEGGRRQTESLNNLGRAVVFDLRAFPTAPQSPLFGTCLHPANLYTVGSIVH